MWRRAAQRCQTAVCETATVGHCVIIEQLYVPLSCHRNKSVFLCFMAILQNFNDLFLHVQFSVCFFFFLQKLVVEISLKTEE